MEKIKKTRKNNLSWWFFTFVVISFFSLIFIKKSLFYESLNFFINILKSVIIILLVVFILMIITNYFFSPKKISKYLGKNSGIKGWLIAIVAGIISHGPIYIWYPLLYELREKGMRNSLMATFMYNRAIKIPLIPFMIIYFSWAYMLILLLVMIIFSIITGMIIEIFDNYIKNEKAKN